MTTVLLNLIDNACKYSPPEAAVALRGRVCSGEIQFEVEDGGEGLSEAQLRQAFEMFERLSPDTSKPGCGLGLPIVKSVVELLGGRVDVESEPGKGTLFRLAFPQVNPKEA